MQSFDHVVLRGQVRNKNLYISTTRVSCNKTWQDDTYLGEILNKVPRPFDHIVLQVHLTNESHYISTTRVSMATKRDRIVTYLDGLLLIYSPEALITWSC